MARSYCRYGEAVESKSTGNLYTEEGEGDSKGGGGGLLWKGRRE